MASSLLVNIGLTIVLVMGVLGDAEGRSDEFGRNPQHDFGSVSGRQVNPVLPFWTMLGDAFANEDFVRLTPDRQSKSGAIWNSQRLIWKNWEIMIKFNVNGVGSVGADGFAFWLAREVNILGNFFGYQERFTGIGVVIDTYDNDGTGMHPLITVLQNDGRKTYDHHHEGGKHVASDMELGHCGARLRNLRTPTLLKVKYEKQTLTIETKAEDDEHWTHCVQVNTVVDTGMYMGLSAATGHLADNHDIYGVTIRNLDEDAHFFDSESRFAQFSKYSIAESLGRIQSDIRGLQPGAKSSEAAPIAAQAGGQQQVTAKIDDSLQNELISLRREVGDVLREMQQNQRGLVDSYNSNNRGSFQELTGPIQRVTQDLNSIEQSLKREVGDMSAETRKLSHIQGKVDRLISTLEKDQKPKPLPKAQEEDSSLFSIFNILFFLVCVLALYLGTTLYRIKKKSGGGPFKDV
eukprot:CAMPEP_0201491984 /NCGR_PEP_ID=MMETSP0151_2-20130828/32002_1 /ASSEMBLY_ACC=CAM_ASM_000257 /TAXON_ID=200890 /ORGANISM="Paramoeba atlantica, Strain 621/1 / CCAP 1560/9" /LENGTH=461 /DNA_ID=CAMNT_0047878623 /DNA_START=57 /DNA_END=1442 /DNA_ORIENTATION=-